MGPEYAHAPVLVTRACLATCTRVPLLVTRTGPGVYTCTRALLLVTRAGPGTRTHKHTRAHAGPQEPVDTKVGHWLCGYPFVSNPTNVAIWPVSVPLLLSAVDHGLAHACPAAVSAVDCGPWAATAFGEGAEDFFQELWRGLRLPHWCKRVLLLARSAMVWPALAPLLRARPRQSYRARFAQHVSTRHCPGQASPAQRAAPRAALLRELLRDGRPRRGAAAARCPYAASRVLSRIEVTSDSFAGAHA